VVIRLRFAPLLAAMLASCVARDQRAAPVDASTDTDAPTGGFSLGSFAGGFDDHLVLPPYFAGTLPLHGREETRESPGLYLPADDQYFSYAVLWWAEGSVDLSTDALRTDVATYYAGLCMIPSATVTLGDPEAGATGTFSSRRAGAMSVGSCFGAAVPPATIEVSAAACPDHTAILILVSPQSGSSPVWADLHSIRDSFTCW